MSALFSSGLSDLGELLEARIHAQMNHFAHEDAQDHIGDLIEVHAHTSFVDAPVRYASEPVNARSILKKLALTFDRFVFFLGLRAGQRAGRRTVFQKARRAQFL